MVRRVLGGVKYLHDLTVTCMDTGYMRAQGPSFPPSSVSKYSDTTLTKQHSETEFRSKDFLSVEEYCKYSRAG